MNELKGDLYFIKECSIEDNAASFLLSLNPDSRIYEGHFPGNPITPGVCLLQTAVELCSEAFGCRCELEECKNIKYIRIISPGECPEIAFSMVFDRIPEDRVKAKVTITSGNEVFTKMSIKVNLV